MPPDERHAWYELNQRRKGSRHTILALAEYWADGRRTAKEIIDLIELETGVRDAELIIGLYELLNKLELMEL